jgi:hypothetical protein
MTKKIGKYIASFIDGMIEIETQKEIYITKLIQEY